MGIFRWVTIFYSHSRTYECDIKLIHQIVGLSFFITLFTRGANNSGEALYMSTDGTSQSSSIKWLGKMERKICEQLIAILHKHLIVTIYFSKSWNFITAPTTTLTALSQLMFVFHAHVLFVGKLIKWSVVLLLQLKIEDLVGNKNAIVGRRSLC